MAGSGTYDHLNIIDVDVEYGELSSFDRWEPAEQIADCCEEIPGADPCTDIGKLEPWNGYGAGETGAWDINEIWARWKKTLGDKLIDYEIISTGGPLKGRCGEKYTEWTGRLGCCEYPQAMYWSDQKTLNAVAREATYTFGVSGGTTPISFSVHGYGVRIVAQTDDLVRIKTDICMCDPVLLVATDSCGRHIIKLLWLNDGTWNSVADQAMWSDYGWDQDGVAHVGGDDGARTTIYGFNGDMTTYSAQSYGYYLHNDIDALVAAVKAEPHYTNTALVIPAGYDGYTAVEGEAIFFKDVTNDPAYGQHTVLAYWATTGDAGDGTYEYEAGVCEDELLYDFANSTDTIASNSSGVIYWEGGVPPFSITFDTAGSEVFVNPEKTESEIYGITQHSWKIYTGEVCEWIGVRVTDSCGVTVDGDIYPTEGYWASIFDLWKPACWAQYQTDPNSPEQAAIDYWEGLGLDITCSGYLSAAPEGPFMCRAGKYAWNTASYSSNLNFYRVNLGICGNWADTQGGAENIYYVPVSWHGGPVTGLLIPAQYAYPQGGHTNPIYGYCTDPNKPVYKFFKHPRWVTVSQFYC